MKKIIVIIICCQLFSFSAFAYDDKEFGREFIFAVKSQVLSIFEFILPQDETTKQLLIKKWRVLIANTEKNDIRLGSATVVKAISQNVEGTNKRVLLITYMYKDKEWDDIVLLLERGSYKLQDIGTTENCFTLNEALRGKNIGNPTLYSLFGKLPPQKAAVEEAVNKIFKIAVSNDVKAFCQNTAYTSSAGDDVKRMKLNETLNPANPKDKRFAEAIMGKIRSLFLYSTSSITESFEVSANGTISIKIRANPSKNVGTFYFIEQKGKLLFTNF